MNNVVLTGRLTKDIELRKTESDKSYTRFSIAVYRDEEHTDFINCVAWNKTADMLNKYCKKGDLIGVLGSITTGSYEKDGNKVYTTDVMVNRVYFLGTKKEETQQEPQEDYSVFDKDSVVLDDDSLPF